MATIREVARKAGVAPSTVSLVLRGGGNVSDDTRTIVDQAIRELQYSARKVGRPRGVTAVGRRNRKNQIGFIAPLTISDFRASAVYEAVMLGIEATAARHNQTLIMRHLVDDTPLPPSFFAKLDGVITFSAKIDGNPLPMVRVMGTQIEGECGDHVTYDNDIVGKLAADYLLSRGHRTCAFFHSRIGQHGKQWYDRYDVNVSRLDVFTKTVTAAGGTVRTNPWSIPGWLPHEPEKMTALLKELLLVEPRPTGLFIPADGLTGPAYALLQAAGIRPGIDVDIVSCNNELPVLSGLHPRPGVIDIHATDVGIKGLHQLLWRIEHPDAPRMRIILDCHMIKSPDPFMGTPR